MRASQVATSWPRSGITGHQDNIKTPVMVAGSPGTRDTKLGPWSGKVSWRMVWSKLRPLG